MVNVYFTNKEQFTLNKKSNIQQNEIKDNINYFISYFQIYISKLKELNNKNKSVDIDELNIDHESIPLYFNNITRILNEINNIK